MENRIRRLAFEKERASNLTVVATVKADKLLEARDRHSKKIQQTMAL